MKTYAELKNEIKYYNEMADIAKAHGEIADACNYRAKAIAAETELSMMELVTD